MSELHSSEPEELGLLAALLGVAPARLLSIKELNVLGNLLVATGSVMLVIAAQAEFLRVQKEEKEKAVFVKYVALLLNGMHLGYTRNTMLTSR